MLHYFLKSKFLSLSKYYVSLTFVSGLLDDCMSDCNGSYTTWTWLGTLAVPAGVAILCWCVIDDEMLRDLIKGGFLLLIEVENAKPRRNVALRGWKHGEEREAKEKKKDLVKSELIKD